MQDIVCDAHILEEIIKQYFATRKRDDEVIFCAKYSISNTLSKTLNKVVKEAFFSSGLIVASTFAFVELSRQFDQIFKDEITTVQFKAFISSPPDWLLISSMDDSLWRYLRYIPPQVTMPTGKIESIEWADAIHVATCLSRENALLATKDLKLLSLDILKGKVIN